MKVFSTVSADYRLFLGVTSVNIVIGPEIGASIGVQYTGKGERHQELSSAKRVGFPQELEALLAEPMTLEQLGVLRTFLCVPGSAQPRTLREAVLASPHNNPGWNL